MGPFHLAFDSFAVLAATAAAADSHCEYDPQLGQNICRVGPAPITPAGGGNHPGVSYVPSQLSVDYQGFVDVLRGFEGLAVASPFRQMASPTSMSEYEARVTEFYTAAQREQNRWLQLIDKTRADYESERNWLAKTRAEADYYRQQIPDLELKAAPIRQRAQALESELRHWVGMVNKARSASWHWSARADEARRDVVNLIETIAPPRLLRVTYANMLAGESLAPLAVRAAASYAEPAAPVGRDFAATAMPATAMPVGNPVQRPLAINPNLSASAKVESLRSLAIQMKNARRTFDGASAELNALRAQNDAAISMRDQVRLEVLKLERDIGYYSKQAETSAQKIVSEKAEFPLVRDKMTLRALQAWVWTYERDNIVIPAVNKFLINNGLKPVVGKFGGRWIIPTHRMANDLSWDKVTNIRGINEFMSVQRRIIALLNPTTSRILQSTKFNASITHEQAAEFESQLEAQLGEDAEEIMEEAGANVPAPYKGLFARMLRWRR